MSMKFYTTTLYYLRRSRINLDTACGKREIVFRMLDRLKL